MVEKLKLKSQEPLESEIQNAICEYLQYKNYFFWRQNNTPIAQLGKNGRYFFRAMSRFAMKGVPDIIVLTDGGYAVFLEVKRPSGKLSPDQIIFRDKCKDVGCEYYTVKSVDDLLNIGL